MTEDARDGAAAPLGDSAGEIDLIAAVLDGEFDESAPAGLDDESTAADPADSHLLQVVILLLVKVII